MVEYDEDRYKELEKRIRKIKDELYRCEHEYDLMKQCPDHPYRKFIREVERLYKEGRCWYPTSYDAMKRLMETSPAKEGY